MYFELTLFVQKSLPKYTTREGLFGQYLYFFSYSVILISMSPEEKSLLERTYKMTEENNILLRSIRRNARFGTAVKITYWIVIIGLSFGAYYLIQPFIKAITGGTYGNEEMQSSSRMDNIQDTVVKFQELFK